MSRREFWERLREEVPLWQREGLVTEEQAAGILRRYDGAEARERWRGLASLLGLLGAILLGIGVIVFLAANWQEVPQWIKLALILAAVAVSELAGYHLRYRTQSHEGTGGALLFLGALLYGAAVFLIAQGFHVSANEPTLVLLWGLGVLPMAYVLSSAALGVLGVGCLLFSLTWLWTEWLGPAEGPRVVCSVLMALGVLLLGLGRAHQGRRGPRPLAAVYTGLALAAVMAGLYPLTFGRSLALGPWASGAPSAADPLYLLLAGLAAASVTVGLAVSRERSLRAAEAAVCAVVLAASAAAVQAPSLGPVHGVAANLLFAVVALGAVAAGHASGETHWVRLGLAGFVLLVVVRYFDMFWEMLPRSLFFAGAGTLLLLIGLFLERARRDVLIPPRRAEDAR